MAFVSDRWSKEAKTLGTRVEPFSSPEAAVPVTGQKDRGLWGREWGGTNYTHMAAIYSRPQEPQSFWTKRAGDENGHLFFVHNGQAFVIHADHIGQRNCHERVRYTFSLFLQLTAITRP